MKKSTSVINVVTISQLKGHVGICEQLLSYSKNIDINFRTDEGETLGEKELITTLYTLKKSLLE